jgi:hypothetical protein
MLSNKEEFRFIKDMNSKPQLLSWLTCDHVHVDPSTGKQTYLGVFSGLGSAKFPFTFPQFFGVLSLTDVSIGQHKLSISMGYSMEETQEVVNQEFESKSPLQRINLVHLFRNVEFKNPGELGIQIDIDGEPLLVTSIIIHGPKA